MLRKALGPLLLLPLAAACGAPAAIAAPTCQEPSPALVSRIVALSPSGTKAVAAGGLKATDHASTYWVAVRFTVKGATHTGVWAVGGGLTGKGTLLAVDDEAQQWSMAADADTSASELQPTEGKAVLACL